MKAHFAFVSILLFAATGCIAQAGTGEESSSSSTEDLNAPSAVVEAQGATNTKVRTQANFEHQQHAKPLGDGLEKGIDLSNPNVNPGDPGDPVQDPGDGNEPDPHPWHTNNATVLKR